MIAKSTQAIAEAAPNWKKFWKAVSYRCWTTVRVASPGPPSVRTNTWPKIWNEPITWVTTTNRSTGRSSGSVIDQKRRQPPAPSSAAAS